MLQNKKEAQPAAAPTVNPNAERPKVNSQELKKSIADKNEILSNNKIVNK